MAGNDSSMSLLPFETSDFCFLLQNPGLVEQYLSAILSLEPNQNYAGMLGLLVQFCTSHKEMDVVNRHKVSARHSDNGCCFASVA